MPHVIKIWQDRALLIPLFLINHIWLVPRLVLKKKYSQYLTLAVLLILLTTALYYFIDKPAPQPQAGKQPTPVPPYADLLLFSLLIVAVDTGLLLTKHWHTMEAEKMRLENENTHAMLGMLRHQVSPHFFMNTLNNIYALVEKDKVKARETLMKLSKLMRYLLYENQSGKVLLSKELEFIQNYIDLMRLRFADEVSIRLRIPESYTDVEIPMLLFISYIENAFRYGTSYQEKSDVEIVFEMEPSFLVFTCNNTIPSMSVNEPGYGIGLQNSRKRLELLFGANFDLTIQQTASFFSVNLKVPLQ